MFSCENCVVIGNLSAFDVTDTKAREIVDDATGDAQLLILGNLSTDDGDARDDA